MNYRIFPSDLQNLIPEIVHEIVKSALISVDPRQLILENLHENGGSLSIADRLKIDLSEYDRIYVTGAGKAVTGMAEGLSDVLGERIHGGVIISKHLFNGRNRIGSIDVLVGNHPVPGEDSLASAAGLQDFAGSMSERDLVFCLITGGGSALMTLPAEGLCLDDLQATTQLLLGCGASINEMNVLRKHLEVLKGGGLARLLYPARVVTLILSDVIDSPLDIIASGPTVADESSFQVALDVLKRHDIFEKAPERVQRYLLDGTRGLHPETVKPGSKWLERVDSLILGDNKYACQAALRTARLAGFNTLLLTNSLEGEASQIGAELAELLRKSAFSGEPLARPLCMLAGGETTVHLRGNGKGGRNQEMALAAVKVLDGLPDVVMIPLATDGEDGPTDAAGALVNGETYRRGLAMGLNPDEFLARNDSWSYFNQIGSGLTPGPTGTNVNDICFLIAY